LLWSLRSRDWCEELLELFGVPRSVLPVSGPNAGAFGSLGIDDIDLPITVSTGDQPAALFAFGKPDPAVAIVNAGTGAFVQCVTGAQPVYARGLLTSLAWQSETDQLYVLEGTVNGAGSALTTIARELGLNPDTVPALLEEWSRTESAPPLFLNGVSGLGSPFWVSNFPSAFIGEGRSEAKMVAVLESIAFLLQVNLDAMRRCGIAPRKLRVTGGLAASAHFCQVLADLSDLPLERPEVSEATARGLAFLLAGKHASWPGAAGAALQPRAGDSALRARFTRWRAALDAALDRAAVTPS
jgi:glycerol kinase